jgi:lipoate-protein ligase A
MRITKDQPWEFIDSGPAMGLYNMQMDEMLARQLLNGTGHQTLRVFQWKPWAVSIGFNQRLEDIDIDKCARDGIDVVRRPTGGRAILHAEELTYSIAMLAGNTSVQEVYNSISSALVRGLSLFGVDAALQRSQMDFSGYRSASAIPCFTSTARYEIEWRGKKLVGSAQRRFAEGERDVVLQHGSILCGPAHRRLADYIRNADPQLHEELTRNLIERTTDISEICGGRVDIPRLAACIRQGFELEWGIALSNHAGIPDQELHAEHPIEIVNLEDR